jgi:transposase
VTEIICGVDVSSDALDARIGQDGAQTRMAATPEGVADLAAFCREHRVTLVVMEATGGYEKLVHALLWSHGIPAAIVNPRSVRQFAQSMGFLEKTDRIDAGVIAWYADTKHIVAQEPASQAQQHLKALVTRLRQLTELRIMQSNQRRLVADPDVNGMFSDMMALIARQSRELEARIAALIDSDPVWQKLDECFRSIKGVSDRTVARVMAEMPEIGTVSNKAVSKLAGLAPLAKDSGKSQGKRSIHGGRANLRNILFVIVGNVRKYDPVFAAFHKRLTEAGKPKKVIRVALAHKLLVQLNAKARDARKELAVAAA